MTVWGIDISSWQAGIDLDQVAREGFSAVIAKATQGGDYASPEYQRQKAGALRNRLRFMAYHYVRADATAVAQVENYERTEPDRAIAVMLDHEDSSGGVEVLRAVHAEFVRRGYRVALVYLPRWYWRDHLGGPDLSGLPPVMASAYGADQPGYASTLYPGDTTPGWAAYGGNTPAVLQFTQRAYVAGREIDAWAFRGTLADLDALLSGGAESEPIMADPTPARDVQTQLRGPQLNGWPQLGGRTLVDGVAAIGARVGVPGCYDVMASGKGLGESFDHAVTIEPDGSPSPTQVQYPGRALLRTVVALLLGLLVALPALVDAAGISQAAPGVAVALTVSALATRVLAIPAVNSALTQWAPWLSATPKR